MTVRLVPRLLFCLEVPVVWVAMCVLWLFSSFHVKYSQSPFKLMEELPLALEGPGLISKVSVLSSSSVGHVGCGVFFVFNYYLVVLFFPIFKSLHWCFFIPAGRGSRSGNIDLRGIVLCTIIILSKQLQVFSNTVLLNEVLSLSSTSAPMHKDLGSDCVLETGTICLHNASCSEVLVDD